MEVNGFTPASQVQKPVVLRTWNGNENQKWQVGSGNYAGTIVWASHPDHCLEPAFGNGGNGAIVQFNTCNGQAYQQWFTPGLGQTGAIQNAQFSGKCVDLKDGSVAQGATIQLYDCYAGNANQEWILVDSSLTLQKTSSTIDNQAQSWDYTGMPSGSAATAVAQLSCTDDACVTDCSNNQWNINQCYNTTGGNSQIFLSCDESGVSEITYAGSDCQGEGTSSHMDTAKCLISETSTSFINTCVTGNVKANLHGAMSLSTKRKATRVAASAVAQLSCTDTECVNDCSNSQWNINECYNTTGGNSQIFLSCDDAGVNGITYTGTDCQGQGTTEQMDVAKCMISETNSSFINTCVSASIRRTSRPTLSSTIQRNRKFSRQIVV